MEFNLDLLFQKSDLIPVIIQDADTLEVLMLGFTNREAVELTIKQKPPGFGAEAGKSCGTKVRARGTTSMCGRCALTATLIPCSISVSRTGLPVTLAAGAAFSIPFGWRNGHERYIKKPVQRGAGPKEQPPGGVLHLLSF